MNDLDEQLNAMGHLCSADLDWSDVSTQRVIVPHRRVSGSVEPIGACSWLQQSEPGYLEEPNVFPTQKALASKLGATRNPVIAGNDAKRFALKRSPGQTSQDRAASNGGSDDEGDHKNEQIALCGPTFLNCFDDESHKDNEAQHYNDADL